MQVSFSFWSCVLLKTWWSIVDTLEGVQLEVIPGCFFRCCWAATRNLCWLVLTGGPHFNYELTTCSDCSPEVISDVSCLAGWQEAFFSGTSQEALKFVWEFLVPAQATFGWHLAMIDYKHGVPWFQSDARLEMTKVTTRNRHRNGNTPRYGVWASWADDVAPWSQKHWYLGGETMLMVGRMKGDEIM